ncbi:acyltransferase [Streptococcus infantarius]|uniref:acyltransferase n=1 Tax=Streptococcus infantarius TaxID=102684 RepID=UPI003D1440D4
MNNLIDESVTLENIELGRNCWIRTFSVIKNSQLHSNIFIGFKAYIENVEIADNVQIATGAVISGGDSGILIEEGCWLGANVTIQGKNIKIGNHSVIGANTFITHSIPPHSIVYGNPNIIKRRSYILDGEPNFDELLTRMIKLKKLGKYLKQDDNQNFISASIKGAPVHIGENNILIGRHLDGVGGIDFKNNISIGNGVVLEAAGGIEIGDNTIIEDDVVIVSNTHDYKKLSLPMLLAPVTIGSNVHIGRGTLILGGVTIPSGSIIREGSFIRK